MGTASMIAKWDNKTGKVVASYCHYDGYPEFNGKMLMEYYNDPVSADTISTIGYASSLETTIADTKASAVHKNESPVTYDSVEQYLAEGSDYAGAEYLYLFDGTAWFVAPRYDADSRFTDVETILKKVA